MHIEPGVVEGAKILLSYATGAGAAGLALQLARQTARQEAALLPLLSRSALATALVLGAFQVLPHYPVGVSEVHLILGSTLFLLLGAGPTALGLALGLLIQGLIFAPFDLPQYGMNLTTLIVPLWALQRLAGRIVAPGTAYRDVTAPQAAKLSAAYQAGIVGWVAFWSLYGQGVNAATCAAIATFALAYLPVIAIELALDTVLLGALRRSDRLRPTLLQRRLSRG
ncbi:energy-coupling factor ABC transporter permease [Pseudooceanicola sp. CBS1P-1]|uniref:Cobalt transporter n=1 Tax=Pseudooceanicola albus TaxID=2692189 RepID=A0A6L7G7X7_9RHOB|nr:MULTISPECIES: energy-coupling factor ABC transporter permease [Pseudooceanicola]MBT9386063.1 energy-coupling factor ABC transporter permease [Pseudooceanicola endophyticus]MXN19516.1 cobalt transporter [Pseudooceanicola albus]